MPDSNNTNPIADLGTTAIHAGLQPVINGLDSLVANPTQLNAVAQAVALQGAFVAALPTLQTTAIKDIALLLKQHVLDLQTKLAASIDKAASGAAASAGEATAEKPDAAAAGTGAAS